jgi:hypothetical protein
MGVGAINMVTTIGSFLFALGVLLFFVNVAKSRISGAPAGDNPWDGPSLEWSIPSPPPPYNFAVIPTIVSRYPLWEGRLGQSELRSNLEEGLVLDHGKETVATSPLDALPARIVKMPKDTIIPFVLSTAMTILFTGLLLKNLPLAAAGGLACAAALVAWFWPRRELLEREPAHG